MCYPSLTIRFVSCAFTLNVSFGSQRASGYYDECCSVVKDRCGIQAPDANAAMLALRTRSVGLASGEGEHARIHERSVERTWGPRGTLHLLATEDQGQLLSLLGLVFIALNCSRRMESGMNDETSTRGAHAIRDILVSQGPPTRDELVEQLAARGILEGQARPHLIFYTALQGHSPPGTRS